MILELPQEDKKEKPKEAKSESIYEMETGRLKERLVELIKVIPDILGDVAKIYIIALKSLGTSEEKIKAEIDEVVSSAMIRSTEGRRRADERFEHKTNK